MKTEFRSDQPHPRCAFAGCEMPGEPCREMPTAYFCELHAQLPREERIRMFHEAIARLEARDAK